jgi:hypothetical protein
VIRRAADGVETNSKGEILTTRFISMRAADSLDCTEGFWICPSFNSNVCGALEARCAGATLLVDTIQPSSTRRH